MDEHRALTDADVAAIAQAVARQQNACSLGISASDAAELCELAAWLRKLKNAVGNVVIYGLVAFLAVLFYMGVGRWK